MWQPLIFLWACENDYHQHTFPTQPCKPPGWELTLYRDDEAEAVSYFPFQVTIGLPSGEGILLQKVSGYLA